jgi:hypothetical protein
VSPAALSVFSDRRGQTPQFIAAIHAASDRTRLRNAVAVFWKPRSLATASGSSSSLKQPVWRRAIAIPGVNQKSAF